MVPALSEDVKDALVRNIRRRMTPQPLKIRADIEMKCFQFDGVLHIKVLLYHSFSPISFFCFLLFVLTAMKDNYIMMLLYVYAKIFLSDFTGSHAES